MRRNRSLVYLLAFWVIAPAKALAYPISPKPLWSLTTEAELVVVAEVTVVDALPPDQDRWDSAVARLRVIETLKGRSPAVLNVPFAANLTCPAPPRYSEGETVVAFLERDEGTWRTVSLSYGTLYPQGSEIEDMTAMVRAAVSLQESGLKPKELNRRKLDWLVAAASLPGTRWHGLYELAPASDRIRSSYDRSGRAGKLRVTRDHQAMLAAALLDAPKIDTTLAMMLRVLDGFEDPRVDRMALEVLEGLLLRDDPPWWASDLMWAVLSRWGDAEPEARLEEVGAKIWDYSPGQLRRVWSAAKGQLGIPDLPAADVELERYVPVGGRTPS